MGRLIRGEPSRGWGRQSGTDPNSVSNGLQDFGQAAALRASVSPSDTKVFGWI